MTDLSFGSQLGKISEFLQRGLRTWCGQQHLRTFPATGFLEEGAGNVGSGCVPPSLQKNTLLKPPAASRAQLPGPSLEKHFGFLERKALPKYRELCWQGPVRVCYLEDV